MKHLDIKKLFITAMVLLCSVSANAYDFEVDGIYYNLTSAADLTVEVTRGDKKYYGDIVIPSTVSYKSKTLTVTSIGELAFYNCYNLISITIPNSVINIESEAFLECKALTSIEIPNSVKTIGNQAFGYCENLTTAIIGNSVTDMGTNTFTSCTKLANVKFSNGITRIGKNAFNCCIALTSITIPNSVTSINY